MDFQKIIEERFSVREFLPTLVENEKITAILQSARLAPTGKNSQPQKIYVITSNEGLQKIKQLTKCAFNSPLVFLICADKSRETYLKYCNESTLITDVSIVQTFMMLKATDLGLGSCWVRYFKSEDATNLFNLPENEIPFGLLFVGYASPSYKPIQMHYDSLSVEEFAKFI